MSELDTLRSEIDEIDTQLTALFLRRMDVTARVGAYKQENGLPVLDEAREQEVLARKSVAVSDPGPQGRRHRPLRDHHGAQPSPAAQSGE